MNNKYKPTMLLIMDGFGLRDEVDGNAIKQADTPNLDRLFSEFPNTKLNASGLNVGLPHGQMGNSEVGHLNIGAGRTVYQDLTRISKAIEDGSFYKNPALIEAIDHAIANNSALHLMGLMSDGGVHSSQEHLYALLKMSKGRGLRKVYVHAFLDGRDTPPRSAAQYLKELEEKTKEITGLVVSICGRYYAMDRDKRWDRVERAYDMLTLGDQLRAESVDEAIQSAYDRGENDEFVQPTDIYPRSLYDYNDPTTEYDDPKTVKDNDSVIFFNFRPDRARELTRCFVDPDFDGFKRKKTVMNLSFVCMAEYDKTLPNVKVAFPPENIPNTFGAYISSIGMKQLRIAETEKYAHVTFFFNGGVEKTYANEERILIPSPKVATYDLKPEMSIYEVTDAVIDEIKNDKFDVIIMNYANPDMVGHSGILDATKKAIEAVDECVGRVANAILDADGQVLITADHGNAELMMDDDNNPITAHSTNMVPLILVRKEPGSLIADGSLADLAPTLLDMMGIEKPAEMTGHSLLKE